MQQLMLYWPINTWAPLIQYRYWILDWYWRSDQTLVVPWKNYAN